MLIGKARRMLALPYLREFARMGLSANAALRELRNINIASDKAAELGVEKGFSLGYRRTDFLEDYRRVNNEDISRRYVSAVGKDKNLNPRRFPSIPMDVEARYRYNVKIQLYSPQDDTYEEVYRHIYSNNVLTRNEQGEQALALFNEEFEGAVTYMGFNPDSWEIADATGIQAYHHEGYTY